MKKISQILAFLLSGAVLTGISLPVHAMAPSMPIPIQMLNPFVGLEAKVPDGYTQVEDYGMLTDYLREGLSYDGRPYTVFLENDGEGGFGIASDFEQCRFEISFNSGIDSGWKEIYEKYSDQLDFDYVSAEHGIYLHDIYNKEGKLICSYDDYDDPSEYEQKRDLVCQMVEELYRAGYVAQAFYRDCHASIQRGHISESFFVEGAETDAETLYAQLCEIKSDIEIVEKTNGYSIENIPDSFQLFELAAAVKSYYPESILRCGAGGNEVRIFAATIQYDVLDGIPSPKDLEYGDVNQDGRISVLDAIYMSKATAQVVSMNTDQITTGDCNGDGAVDAEDINLLLMYLVEKIDTLPVSSKT